MAWPSTLEIYTFYFRQKRSNPKEHYFSLSSSAVRDSLWHLFYKLKLGHFQTESPFFSDGISKHGDRLSQYLS